MGVVNLRVRCAKGYLLRSMLRAWCLLNLASFRLCTRTSMCAQRHCMYFCNTLPTLLSHLHVRRPARATHWPAQDALVTGVFCGASRSRAADGNSSIVYSSALPETPNT
jgi:hypothetical protein